MYFSFWGSSDVTVPHVHAGQSVGAELVSEAERFISMASLAWANLGKSIFILPIKGVFHVTFAGNMG